MLRISTHRQSDGTGVSVLVEDVSRNACFFSGSNIFITIIIIIIILLQLGVHPVAVDLTLILTRKVYNIREQCKTKYVHTINKVHTVQIQTYKVITYFMFCIHL
jgi:hypothetical protein